jgi:hypothetical protein
MLSKFVQLSMVSRPCGTTFMSYRNSQRSSPSSISRNCRK